MTNMIERVARAIVKGISKDFTDADIDSMWDGWRDDAESAIKALREPTDWMVSEGSWIPDYDGINPIGDEAAIDVWQAMIDAALTPKIEE